MELTQISQRTEAIRIENRAGLVPLAVALYAALILLSLVLRVAQLDTVPLTDSESRQALAAWRIVQPEAAGPDITAESPLLFLVHSLSFTVLGASEFTARIGTAVAGISLILFPLLFRRLLGWGRTFFFSLILTFSPVLLLASRGDSPVVWTLLLAGLALWAGWRYYESGEAGYATLATVLAFSAILLTDPTAPIFALILLGALIFASRTHPSELSELPDAEAPESIAPGERLRAWPWQTGLLFGVVVVGLVSTVFMLYPAGLSAVSELLASGFRGLTTAQPNTPVFFPALVTLFYEPVTLIVAVIAVISLVRRSGLTFADRFFVGWLIFGLIASFLYAGGGAEQALWLTVPLAGLAASLAAAILDHSRKSLWLDAPSSSRWVIAVIGFFMFGMFSIHTQSLGRSLLNVADDSATLLNLNSSSVIWVLISLLFMVIGFFLAASIWGLPATSQGALLGLLAFGLLTSLGSGWNAAVVQADNPVEFWNRQPVSKELLRLRETLKELAERESGGFPGIPVAALVPSDGAVAWTIRDFSKTEFITETADAQGREIVILPRYSEPPDLGGPYVGQTFLLRRSWSASTLRLIDSLSWWTQRRVRTVPAPSEQVILWLRQDVYNGVPFEVGVG